MNIFFRTIVVMKITGTKQTVGPAADENVGSDGRVRRGFLFIFKKNGV